MNRKKTFSDRIREKLLNHEEPYVLGSWERFQEHKKKKSIKAGIRVFVRVAAVILLVLSSFYLWTKTEEITEQAYSEDFPVESPNIRKFESLSPPAKEDHLLTADDPEGQSAGRNNRGTSGKGSVCESAETGEVLATAEPDIHETEGGHTGEEAATDSIQDIHRVNNPPAADRDISIDKKTGGAPSAVPPPSIPRRSLAADRLMSVVLKNEEDNPLQNEGVLHNNTAAQRLGRSLSPSAGEFEEDEGIRRIPDSSFEKSIQFSIAYASMIHTHDAKTDLGAGGGLYADWKLARNMALSSGVFIAGNQLKYGTEDSNIMRIMEDEVKQQTSGDLSFMQVDLVSLEIPLSFHYSVSENLSVSAGISSMAFLKESYNYTFEYQQEIQTFRTSETGLESVTRMVTLTESQKQSEPSLNGMDWSAFYTLSVGYQQRLAGHTFSFEPFLKMPTGRLAARNIRYTTGGVQLKFSF